MSQHSKFTDGKILRAKNLHLLVPDLMMLLRGLETAPNHNIDDLRRLDAIRNKVNDALEEGAPAFYAEYTDAVNGVEMEVAEKNIVNGMLVAMLREQALRPIMLNPDYANTQAPDVYLSATDWSWAQKKWRSRESLAGDPDNTARTLRIADVLDGALGYKNMPDRTIAIEGETDDDSDTAEPTKLKAV